jgi:hypothetical protein
MKEFKIVIQDKEIIVLQDDDGYFIKPEIVTELEKQGTAIKPAHELICMARKPLKEKTIVENVIKWGVGGINIDESRIAPIGMTKGGCKFKSAFFESGDSNFNKEFDESKGRFPANLIWTHHPDCKYVGTKKVKAISGGRIGNAGSMLNMCGNTHEKGNPGKGDAEGNEIVESWECVEGCPSKEFDKAGKCGNIYSGERKKDTSSGTGFTLTGADKKEGMSAGICDGLGSPARFFKSFSYEQEDLDYAPFYYCAKASKSERNEGLDGGRESRKNFHPTVKPIKLMEYLIKMVTPKGGVVLDPFMGSGTTGCACVKNGYKFVGIEMTEEYIPIAEARIKAHVPTQQKLEGIE